jgi:hypothetical protein
MSMLDSMLGVYIRQLTPDPKRFPALIIVHETLTTTRRGKRRYTEPLYTAVAVRGSYHTEFTRSQLRRMVAAGEIALNGDAVEACGPAEEGGTW